MREQSKHGSNGVEFGRIFNAVLFVPVLFVQESSGQLFRDIAIAIACAVGLSMIVSFTMIPTAASRLFAGKFDDGDHDTAAKEQTKDDANSRHSTGLLIRTMQWIGSTKHIFLSRSLTPQRRSCEFTSSLCRISSRLWFWYVLFILPALPFAGS